MLLVLVTTIASFGQNFEVIDSLKILLKITPVDEKIKLLNQVGWEYRLSKPDTTIYYTQQAYDLALQHNKYIDASVSLNYIGIAHGYLGDHVQSYFYYEQSVELFSQHLDSVQLAYAYNNIGRLLFSQADMVKSYAYFTKALYIFQRYDDLEGLGYTYQSLARLYGSQENFPKALEISKKVLEIRERTKNVRGQISSIKEIAEIHVGMHDYYIALQQLDRARTIALNIDDIISLSEIDLSLSKVLYHLKNFSEALNYCNRALITASKNNNKELLLEINLQFGKIYYATKQYKKAENYLLGTIKKANKSGLIKPLYETYKYLYLTYEDQNMYLKSLSNYKSFVMIKDSLYNADMARTIQKLENRLEIEQKDKENKLLKSKEGQSQQLFVSEKNKSTAYMAAIILTVIAIAILLFYLHQHIKHEKLLTKQKEYIEELNQKINKQNHNLETRNVDLAEMNNEKDNLMNIVAHDLKSPFNNLKGLCELMELSGSLNSEQKNYIKIMKQVSEKGVSLARDILDVNAFTFDNEETLKPEIVDVYDFLQYKVDSFKTESSSKQITIQAISTNKTVKLETDENSLSRILDNLISNSIKFSPEKTTIQLKSSIHNNNLRLIIADQGPGFSEEDKKHIYKKFMRLSARPTGGESSNGLGLAIVKTLTNRIHGKISLISDPKKGSEFTIELPLKFVKKKNTL